MYRILHVDDDESDFILLQHKLKGFKDHAAYTWAPSGIDALEILENNGFDCIISDFQMPMMNGLEFLTAVRESGNSIPFIFYTGQGSETVAAEALRSGADDYYTKEESFAHFERLFNSINKHIQAYRQEIARFDSEQKYRTLFEEAHNPILVVDEDGKYIEANSAALRFLECTQDELIGKSVWDFTVPSEVEIQKQEHTPFLAPRSLETRYLINGTVKTLMLNIVPIKIGEKNVLYGIGQDITRRKKTEEELIRSELFLKQAQSIAHVGSWVYDVKDDHLEWSDEVFKIFGLDPEYFRANLDNAFQAIHPEDRSQVQERFLESISSGQESFETEFRVVHIETGEIHHCLSKSNNLLDNSGKVVRSIGIVQDITDRINTELALRESEEKYKALYDNAPLPYQSLDRNGCFIDVNPHWLKVLGYERDEVIGKNFSEFLHPDNKFKECFLRFKESGLADEVPFKMKRKQGDYIDVSYRGQVGYWPNGEFRQTYCVFQDVTEKKAFEQRIVEQNNKLNEIFQNSPNIMMIVDTEGKLISLNDKALSMVRGSLKDLVGMAAGNAFSCVHALDSELGCGYGEDCERCPLRNTVMESLKTQKSIHRRSGELRKKSGDEVVKIDYLVSTVPAKINGIEAAIVYLEDVTHLRKIEYELREINQSLELFSHAVSHDLKSPARQFSSFLDLMEESIDANNQEQGRAALELLRRTNNKVTERIKSLQRLSEIRSREIIIEKVDLLQIANDAYKCEKEIFKDWDGEFLAPTQVFANCDPSLMRSVFDNLIGNAIKYSAKSSNPVIEFGVEDQQHQKVYFVRDNGAGFDQKKAEMLFLPFQRLHKQDDYPGTGIGLALVKSIIQKHGGKIWAEGHNNSGATFFFTLE